MVLFQNISNILEEEFHFKNTIFFIFKFFFPFAESGQQRNRNIEVYQLKDSCHVNIRENKRDAHSIPTDFPAEMTEH